MTNDRPETDHEAWLWIEPDLNNGDLEKLRKHFTKSPGLIHHSINAEGETVFHRAVQYGQCKPELVDLLVEFGADVNALNNDGKSALCIAATRDHPLNTFLRLLDHGAKPVSEDTPNHVGFSVLHNALVNDQNEMVRALIERFGSTLLEHEIDIDANQFLTSSNGSRPLHCAARTGNALGCKLLLQAGADVHALGGAKRQTAIEMASAWLHEETVLMLIAFGADPLRSKNATTFTPEMAAAEIGENDLLLSMHHKREAEGRPISSEEMEEMIRCANRGGKPETVALIHSLQAQDAIHGVLEAACVASHAKACAP